MYHVPCTLRPTPPSPPLFQDEYCVLLADLPAVPGPILNPVSSSLPLLQDEYRVLLVALLTAPGPRPTPGSILPQGFVELQVCGGERGGVSVGFRPIPGAMLPRGFVGLQVCGGEEGWGGGFGPIPGCRGLWIFRWG